MNSPPSWYKNAVCLRKPVSTTDTGFFRWTKNDSIRCVEFQKALETSADTTTIVSKKNALRDAPAAKAISDAKTPAELKAAWDTSTLGDSPYAWGK